MWRSVVLILMIVNHQYLLLTFVRLLVSVLQVLEPSRVLSVIHTFDCHTGEVTAVSKSFFDSSAIFYVVVQLSSVLVGRSVA